MITTFNLSADELDMSILKSIKEAFKGRKIEIIISDSISKTEIIEERIKNLKSDKNIISFSQDEFFKTYKKKISEATN